MKYLSLMRFFVFSIWIFITIPWASPDTTALKLGEEAPKFMLPSLDGDRISIRDLCGDTLRQPWKNKTKYHVILSFWATYCIPCRKEIPELEALVKDMGDSVKLLLVSIDTEGNEKVAAFVKEMGFSSTVLIDRYQVAAKSYGVSTVPALFLMDKSRKLRFSMVGYEEDSIDRLKAALAGLGMPDADAVPEL